MKCTVHIHWGIWQCGNRARMFKGERISGARLCLQTSGPVWKVMSHHYTQPTWHFGGNDLPPCQGTVGLLEHRTRMNNIFTPPQKGVRECELNYTPDAYSPFILIGWPQYVVEVILSIDHPLIPSLSWCFYVWQAFFTYAVLQILSWWIHHSKFTVSFKVIHLQFHRDINSMASRF